MSDGAKEPFLEVLGAEAPQGPAAQEPLEPWLEPVEGQEQDPSPRRKVRAGERAATGLPGDAAALVASLQADGPLLAALWPHVSPAELLREPPPEEAFAVRCDYALRVLDAAGRRDDDARDRVRLAVRNLQEHLERLGRSGGTPREAALRELSQTQEVRLVEALKELAGTARVLYPSDLPKVELAATRRGFDLEHARGLFAAAGVTLQETEGATWTAFEGFPEGPATMDALALCLLRQPAQGFELVRAGAVLAWLTRNGASPEVVRRSRDARSIAERPRSVGVESLAVHTQAWALGRRDLLVGGVWVRSPAEIGPAVRAGSLRLEDLAGSAREGVLSAWLRMHGAVAASGAAEMVASGETTGMKRLAWSLGEPFSLAGQGFTEPSGVARMALARPEVREALEHAHALGDLLAWMESLAPALRDPHWMDALRRAQASGNDPLALWVGVYAQARQSTFEVKNNAGTVVLLSAVEQLRSTSLVADVWDDLRRALRSGELLAWLTRQVPGFDPWRYPRPVGDDELELNALLWDLGNTGLVLEWGVRDLAVTAPEDLVRAYQGDCRQLEAHLSRGHVEPWLERFHGERRVGSVPLGEALGWLRSEHGRLPSGYLALKCALLCGLRYLPLDPNHPADQATFRGYAGVTREGSPGPSSWEPLRDHVATGTALLWLAQLPEARPDVAASLVRSAFSEPGRDNPQERAGRFLPALASSFGAPVPSAVLAAELSQALGRGAVSAARASGAAKAPRRGASVAGPLALALLALGVALVLWGLPLQRAETPPPSTSAVWTRVEVRVHAERANGDLPWDLDLSGPELRVTLRVPGSNLVVGPCTNARDCARTVENVPLVPNEPFRVDVDEVDALRDEHLATRWVRWQGQRREELTLPLGSVTLRLNFTRTVVPATPVRSVEPTPVPRRDAGAQDPGTRPRSRPRRRATPDAAAPPLPPPWPP